MAFGPDEWQVLGLSLRVALCCVLVSLLPAVGFGWLLARREFPLKILLDDLLLLLFGRRGAFGPLLEAIGLQLAFDWKGAVLASAVVGFPLMLRAVRLGIESVDPRLESAARTLGASRLRAFATITLRLALPGLLVGSLLTFARSLGEFGATITFAANIAGQTRTLPAAVYTYLNQPGGEARAIGLVVLSIALSLVALIASEWSARRLRAK